MITSVNTASVCIFSLWGVTFYLPTKLLRSDVIYISKIDSSSLLPCSHLLESDEDVWHCSRRSSATRHHNLLMRMVRSETWIPYFALSCV